MLLAMTFQCQTSLLRTTLWVTYNLCRFFTLDCLSLQELRLTAKQFLLTSECALKNIQYYVFGNYADIVHFLMGHVTVHSRKRLTEASLHG